MSFEIITSDYFDTEAKALAKRYKSFKKDLIEFRKELEKAPLQGSEIAPNIRKIRMAIATKGRGKSGGARIITYNALVTEQEGKVYLLLIYDKADASGEIHRRGTRTYPGYRPAEGDTPTAEQLLRRSPIPGSIRREPGTNHRT